MNAHLLYAELKIQLGRFQKSLEEIKQLSDQLGGSEEYREVARKIKESLPSIEVCNKLENAMSVEETSTVAEEEEDDDESFEVDYMRYEEYFDYINDMRQVCRLPIHKIYCDDSSSINEMIAEVEEAARGVDPNLSAWCMDFVKESELFGGKELRTVPAPLSIPKNVKRFFDMESGNFAKKGSDRYPSLVRRHNALSDVLYVAQELCPNMGMMVDSLNKINAESSPHIPLAPVLALVARSLSEEGWRDFEQYAFLKGFWKKGTIVCEIDRSDIGSNVIIAVMKAVDTFLDKADLDTCYTWYTDYCEIANCVACGDTQQTDKILSKLG